MISKNKTNFLRLIHNYMNDNIPAAAVNTVHRYDAKIQSRQRRIKTGLCELYA